MKKLILFDIDGTLLTTDGAAGRAFEAALIDVYGTAGPIGEVSFAGKTDPQIAHELMGRAGVPEPDVHAGLTDLWERYLEYFDRELVSTEVRVFAGVAECLDLVEERADEAILGLLTGNIRDGAQRKIDAAGLDTMICRSANVTVVGTMTTVPPTTTTPIPPPAVTKGIA